jgi:hypothetical protein
MIKIGATQALKFVSILAPISLNGTAATSLSLDCQGYKYATIVFHSGLIGAATYDELSLTESNDDSSYAAITGSAHADPLDGDDGKIWAWHLDLRKRKRYIQAVIDPGAVACLASCLGILSVAEQMPDSATEAGLGFAAIIL